MKPIGILLSLILLCVGASRAQISKTDATPLTVIRAGTLIDGQSESPRKNQLIFVRDVETEGAGYGDIEIRQAIEEGTIPGPRIFGATRGISTTGGYNLEGYAPELVMPKGVQIVGGPVEARKAAREQLEH